METVLSVLKNAAGEPLTISLIFLCILFFILWAWAMLDVEISRYKERRRAQKTWDKWRRNS